MAVGVEMTQAEAERRVRGPYDNTGVALLKNATFRGVVLKERTGTGRLWGSSWTVETT